MKLEEERSQVTRKCTNKVFLHSVIASTDGAPCLWVVGVVSRGKIQLRFVWRARAREGPVTKKADKK
jgi:hypothetical protein